MASARGYVLSLLLSILVITTRELTDQLSYHDVALHLIIILAVSFIFIYPPEEFIIDFGATLYSLHEDVFFRLRPQFIQYNCLRIYLHWTCLALIPSIVFGYFVHGAILMKDSDVPRFPPLLDYPNLFLFLFGISVTGLLFFSIATVNHTKWNFYKFFIDNPSDEERLNEQMAAPDTFRSELSRTMNRNFYLTEEFFVYISNWDIIVSNLDEVVMTVTNVSIHALDMTGEETKQLVTLQVTFQQDYLKPLNLAMTVSSFHNLYYQSRVQIRVPEGITIQATREEKFLKDFEKIVMEINPTYEYDGEIDVCFGCSGNGTQVKLLKACPPDRREFIVNRNGEIQPLHPCEGCQCQPYWCISCMGRVYYASQDKENYEEHFNGTSQCPTCRKHFCIADVHAVVLVGRDKENQANDAPQGSESHLGDAVADGVIAEAN